MSDEKKLTRWPAYVRAGEVKQYLAQMALPVILVDIDTHRMVRAAAHKALALDPHVFVQDGRLVRLSSDYEIRPMTLSLLDMFYLPRAAIWIQIDKKKKGFTQVAVPKGIAKAVFDLGCWPCVKVLKGVEGDEDIAEERYDAETGILYVPKGEVV